MQSFNKLKYFIVIPAVCLALAYAGWFPAMNRSAIASCPPAVISVIVRDAEGKFIPKINVAIHEQLQDVNGKAKPGSKKATGQVSETLGRVTLSFQPTTIPMPVSEYSIKVWDRNESVGEMYFYDLLNGIGCGSQFEVTVIASGIRFVLRDAQQVLKKNIKFSLYTQRFDADGKPIKDKLIGTYNTGERGEVSTYVTDKSRTIDGQGNDIYVIEATGQQGGTYTKFGIRVTRETMIQSPYVFSDLVMTVKDMRGVLYPANTKVEFFKQSQDLDGQKITGTRIRDILTNDKGVAIFENSAGIYAARVKGANQLYKYFWDLEIKDEQRREITLTMDSDFRASQGACEQRSELTVIARNSAGEFIPGITYELYEKGIDVNGSPIALTKATGGKVGTDGKGVVLFNPHSTKSYILKMYDKSGTAGDFWFFDDLKFSCGEHKTISKTLSSIRVVLRDGGQALLPSVPFSILTQQTDIDGKPLAEKKDLVANISTSAEGYAVIYVAPDHPYNKNKKGIYALSSKNKGSDEYVHYSIRVTNAAETTVEYTFSDMVLDVQDAGGNALANKPLTVFKQTTDVHGRPTHDARAVRSLKTDTDGIAMFASPANTFAVDLKDAANATITFWNIKMENMKRIHKTLITSLLRVTATDLNGVPRPEKTAISIYSLYRDNQTGYYYKQKKIAGAAISQNGSADVVLASGPYLVTVSDGQTEFGKPVYIHDGKLFALNIEQQSEYAITATSKFTVQDRLQTFSLPQSLANRLKGMILLQVESKGEAWYVDTVSKNRLYLKNGAAAYQLLRKMGIGITNENLLKIPIGTDSRFQETDSDSDGLSDKIESSLGTDPNNHDSDGDGFLDGVEIFNGFNPLGSGRLPLNTSFSNQHKGKIFLQVEARGEAWYVNPKDGKRYYLADGEAAYNVMRFLGLGITNEDLRKIPQSSL